MAGGTVAGVARAAEESGGGATADESGLRTRWQVARAGVICGVD